MRYVRSNLFVLRSILGEYLLFPVLEQQKNFQGGVKLNYMAKRIWDYIEIPMDICSISTKIADEYEINYDIVMQDVSELIDCFVKSDIAIAINDK